MTGILEMCEQVLLLLPLIGKPLQAKYYGPYTVVKKIHVGEAILISTQTLKRQKELCM